MLTISAAEMDRWLDEIARSATLVAPRRTKDSVAYRPVRSSAEVEWNYDRPALSIKELFFPTTERLMTIEKHPDGVRLHESVPQRSVFGPHPNVVFGVRPCDAHGVLAMDAVFLEKDPPDPYYAKRRDSTILIGLACTEPGPYCFCTQAGLSPGDPAGMDLMVYPLEEGFAVLVVTEKGKTVISKQLSVNSEPYPEDENWSLITENEIRNTRNRIPFTDNRPVEMAFPDPSHLDWPALFESPVWAQMAERCLSCRICAYVCPTCRCFDVRDELGRGVDGQQFYERVRCWDSCTSEAYRRIAGGHNPRAQKAERLRNRFFCKFHYYPQQYRLSGSACTGCGRCIEACPANIDITEALALCAQAV